MNEGSGEEPLSFFSWIAKDHFRTGRRCRAAFFYADEL
jgi:hypothetical protein